MATNLERLRAKKAANQEKESTLSASFTIDTDTQISKETEASIEQSSTKEENSKASSAVSSNRDEKVPDTSTDNTSARATKPAADSGAIKPINNINNIVDSIPINPNMPEKNLGLRLASEEDKRYLDLAPLSRSMTKKSFFISLMENEIASTKEININDPEIEQFRSSSLKTTAITISVPVELIDQIKKYSAKHMMKYQRYVAYVIHKARNTDKQWKVYEA